jgi:hypothetical protein
MNKGGEIIKIDETKNLDEDFLFFLENSSIENIFNDSRSAFQFIFKLNEGVKSPYLQITSESIYKEGERMIEVRKIFIKLVIIKKDSNSLEYNRIYGKHIETNNSFQTEIFTQIDIINKTNEYLSSVTPYILYYKIFDPLISELSKIFLEKLREIQENDSSKELLIKLFNDKNFLIGIIGMELLPNNFQSLDQHNNFQLASAIYEIIRTSTKGYIHMDAHIHNIKWIPNYEHYYRGDEGENIKGRIILIDWGIIAKIYVKKHIEKLIELFNTDITDENVLNCYNYYKKIAITNIFSIDCQPIGKNIDIGSNLLKELVKVFRYRKNEENYLSNPENPENEFYNIWNENQRNKFSLISDLELNSELLEWPNDNYDTGISTINSSGNSSYDEFDIKEESRQPPPIYDPNYIFEKSLTTNSKGGKKRKTNKKKRTKKRNMK